MLQHMRSRPQALRRGFVMAEGRLRYQDSTYGVYEGVTLKRVFISVLRLPRVSIIPLALRNYLF